MSEKMKTYKAHPMSLVFSVLTKIAVGITIAIFFPYSRICSYKRSAVFKLQSFFMDIYK